MRIHRASLRRTASEVLRSPVVAQIHLQTKDWTEDMPGTDTKAQRRVGRLLPRPKGLAIEIRGWTRCAGGKSTIQIDVHVTLLGKGRTRYEKKSRCEDKRAPPSVPQQMFAMHAIIVMHGERIRQISL